MRYEPWDIETIGAQLQQKGCACTSIAVSTRSSQVEGDVASYRATHTCRGCKTTVTEVANPDYVMPPDVDR